MLRLRRSRREKLLEQVRKNGFGIEIGPSFRPTRRQKRRLSRPCDGSHEPGAALEKYRTHAVDLESIEEVDFVWHGEPYTELTGKTKFYDWIIASHVIEHTPDLLGFLTTATAF